MIDTKSKHQLYEFIYAMPLNRLISRNGNKCVVGSLRRRELWDVAFILRIIKCFSFKLHDSCIIKAVNDMFLLAKLANCMFVIFTGVEPMFYFTMLGLRRLLI